MSRVAAQGVRKYVPGLVALAGYKSSWFRYDLVAGVSVAAVAVPVAIAYSQLAGVPPVYGLYASILPLVAYAVFGTSRQLIMAPDAAACAIVAAVVVPLAGGDPARRVSLAMTLSMMAGVFCIAAGLARLGFVTNFLARPILAGYLNGISISIISGQLGTLFGFEVGRAGFFRTVVEFASRLGQTHGVTLAVGVTAFVLLRALKRGAPRIPAPLIAVALGIVASLVFHLGERGVVLLGPIPAGLPEPMIPSIAMSDLQPLAIGAIGLALISFNSAMVTARGFAVKNRYEIEPNQELIALGVADIGAGALQGFAVSGADSRTAVNDSAGGKSQVTGLVAAGLIVVVLLFLTTQLATLPIVVLSAVLVSAAMGLLDFPGLVRLRQISRPEFRLSIITLLGVITVGVLPGVLVAVSVAMLQLLVRASRPHDAVLGRIPGTDEYHEIKRQKEAGSIPGLLIYRFDSALVFFNSDYFKSRVRALVAEADAEVRCFILDAETMPNIDSTGAASLSEVCNELTDRGIAFVVAEAKGPVRDMLELTGFTQQIGVDRMFPTLNSAVAQMGGVQR